MRPAFVLLLTAALFVPAAMAKDAPAQPEPTPKGKADKRVQRQLDKLKYTYEVDEDGDYKLVFDMSNDDDTTKRSQLVYVRSPVYDYGTVEVREVWAPAYKAKGDKFPADVANRLLEASQDSKLGGWAKQGAYAVFVVKLPTNASAEQLDDAIDAAVQSADQMEAELTPGKDEF